MRAYDYVIVGNSAGAAGCIEGLRCVDKSGSIAVIAEENRHIYSRALVPYYLDGKIAGEKMYYRPADFYKRAAVDLLEDKAVKLDTALKRVELADGRLVGYGKLLLATGGRPIFPPIPGLDKKNVFSFHSLDDALGIEETLPAAKNAVILGGGVIGLMAAEVLHRKGLQVHVLELADRLLAPVIDETASALVEKTFQEAGVEINTRNTIEKIHGADRVENITLRDGRTIPCDILIVGVGVTPRVELAEGTDIKINRGIVVNRNMQTSAPDVYACGDCASTYNFVTGETHPLPLWPNAYRGGRIAAFNMAGLEREYTWGTSMNAMHFFDLNLINAGLNITGSGGGDWEIIAAVDEQQKTYRKFVLNRDGRIKGFVLAGQIARAGIFLNLMRREIDVRGFRQELLSTSFGYSNLPDDMRWQLLENEVILGVV
ncbi:NAD(P)/FAD-dependent oxidoreductase [Desulfoscipio geothermicus]|uniref:Pyridine nucleotide-disulphide oxidoreductase n=1 Tax=Desulfoscipio geothermicus DSM 3669 TaxID=1121426 RepID=A0A1I6DPS0_9FIRM|nr:FAD-dependent oxidoreductase [Desulfoscipio geothermicus]SFR07381.1 Pyridine nucleotide-disulphide oxidoreductase [Desulfoscipio geothermicus DSM 3669]